MSVRKYSCPSCSGALSVEHRFTKVVICPYCGQTSKIHNDELDPTGLQAKLVDFDSVLSLGATGEILGEAFKVLGRLRYEYEDGFWDEWYLKFEKGKSYWLQEDEGEFILFEKESLTSAVPAFEEISVGSMISVNGLSVFVTEKTEAKIGGGEGELSFVAEPGDEVNTVDGNSEGRLISLEFSPNSIELSLGKELSLDQINITQ
jgi:hypothetical protein